MSLNSFYISRCEITQAQWRFVMGSNPSLFFNGRDNYPIENISAEDVKEFLIRLNSLTGKKYRLPTEGEWEFAARGGKKKNKYVYSGSRDIDKVAFYRRNSEFETHPVAQKTPNKLGLYDMSGNVWEWCSDWYSDPYYANDGSNENPKGPSKGNVWVMRGGSWSTDPTQCRVSARATGVPDLRLGNIGFRLVRD